MMLVHPRQERRNLATLFEKLLNVQPASLGHYLSDAALSPHIKAMVPVRRMIGTAVTVKVGSRDGVPVHLALDELQPGDILVIDRQGDHEIACVGEMVALAAFNAGASGIVVDGVVTDIEELRAIGLPVFARGTNVLTMRALALSGAEIFGQVDVGGIEIATGDILYGDANGVLRLRADDGDVTGAIENAAADEARETEWRIKLASGHKLSELSQAREKASELWLEQRVYDAVMPSDKPAILA